MKTKQEITDYIQNQYDIGSSEEQHFYGWASDEILKFKTPLTFVKSLRKDLEESLTSATIHYYLSSLINYIEEI